MFCHLKKRLWLLQVTQEWTESLQLVTAQYSQRPMYAGG